MEEYSHTPLPWSLRGEREIVGPDSSLNSQICIVYASETWILSKRSSYILSPGERNANRAFIVKAVNAHDDLVAALTVLVQLADDHGLEQERGGLPAMLAARAALAKAEATR